MMTSGKIMAMLLLASVLLLVFQPLAAADGIPLTRVELHSTLRENRQIAYIKVADDGRSQTLDLFLSVVSLEPGNELTVMIPLRTKPYSISGREISESQFRQERNYHGIMRLAEKQNRALAELGDSTADAGRLLARLQFLGIGSLLLLSMGGDSGGISYPIADGVSMELLSFNTSDSLAEFYASQGVDAPADVAEMVARYGEFHVGLLHSVTRPPIEQEKFDRIVQHCPDQLDRFREFVAANPTLTDSAYYGYYDLPFMNPELAAILRSIPDYDLRSTFSELIMATYGWGANQGTLVSFHLPLNGHTAFFPLGTTPAWSGVHLTQVIFDIDDSMMMDFNRKGDEVFHNGRHYYVWDFGAGSPDYDLEGVVKTASLGTDLNRAARQAEQYIYERSDGLGMALALLFFLGLWTLGLWALSRMRNWEPGGKRRFLELLGVAAVAMMASMVLTVIVGAMVALAGMAMLEHRHLRPGQRFFRSPRRVLAFTLGVLLLLNAFFCAAGFTLGRDEMAFSLPMILGFLASVMMLLYISMASDAAPEYRMGAWFLYLALMAPAFFAVNMMSRGFGYCTLAFLLFMAIQTAVYVQMARMEVMEPAPEPTEWWMDTLE